MTVSTETEIDMKTLNERRKEYYSEALKDFELDLKNVKKPEQAKKILELTKEGLRSREIAEILGITPKTVQKTWRRFNFPDFQNKVVAIREERTNWAGGVKDLNGYLHLRVIDHPYKSKHGGYVAVHRLVMEEKLGRYLDPKEVVHHIDGNPKNNHPDNLEVFANNSEHLRETLAGKCPKWSEEGKAKLSAALKKRWAKYREEKSKEET